MSEDAERIVGLYRRHADAWDMARGRQHGDRPMEAGWLDQFLALLSPRPTVLDLGCGSGEPIGRTLVERGCELTGVDSAPEMIRFGEARLPGQVWRVADMRSLCLGRVFDGKREPTPTFRLGLGLSRLRAVLGVAVRDGRERVLLRPVLRRS